MTNVFKKIFDVKFIHEYYSSGYADDLVYTPTENCQQLMKNLGMLFRKNSKGFSVLYLSDADGNAVKSFSDKQIFSFIIESSNPYFNNLSKLPINSAKNTVYNFSNVDSDGNYKTKLTESDDVGEDDNISLKRQNFVHSFQSQNLSATIEIKNCFDESILSEDAKVNNGEANYFVELHKHRPGFYELFADGTSDLKFYTSDELFRIKPFGIIDIVREDLSEISYTINIAKKMTFWRYYVIAKYRKETTKDHLKLCVPKSVVEEHFSGNNYTFVDDKLEIEPDSQSSNPDGLNVIPIEVEEELPLLEETMSGFQLKINNGSSYELNDLPNPSVKNISRSLVNGKPEGNKIYSDIYIYI